MEPIDISSSDSDFDTDDDVEAVHSPEIKRRLPSWSSVSHANADVSSSRGSTSRGAPSYAIHCSPAEPGPSTSYNMDADFRFPKENGTAFQSKTYNEGVRGNNSTYAQNIECQQESVKRTLPPSLQPPGMRSKQNNLWDNLSRNHGGENNGGFYHPVGLSSANPRSYGKDSFSWCGDEDLHSHSRVLPHTLARGKPVSLAQYASNDPFQNTGFGEERVSGDERLIFQAALQVYLPCSSCLVLCYVLPLLFMRYKYELCHERKSLAPRCFPDLFRMLLLLWQTVLNLAIASS